MAAKITAEELILRGNFRKEMFDYTEDQFGDRVDQAVLEASGFIAAKVGSEIYASADEPRATALKTAEMDEGHIQMLRTMLTVVTGYDAEQMPPELLNPGDILSMIEQLERHRDDILDAYSQSDQPGTPICVGTVQVDETETT
jgi:hypothetical protein